MSNTLSFDGQVSRRSFLRSCAATGVCAALGWEGRAAEPGPGATLPPWKPGELELHFIYTGCGENMFYRLPDGTAILNDTGDYYRPKELVDVPLLPSPERLGGEWVARYLARVYPEKVLDYAIFSHWHSDHVGHADFDRPETPHEALRSRTLPDGRRVNGFLCVAEEFKVRQLFDHQYPNRGQYGTADTSRTLLTTWEAEQLPKGLKREPFRVGALNQIALQRDAAKYAGTFSIRNLAANGVIWDGADGVRDCAAEHVAVTGKNKVPQNMLSMSFVMRYGKFSYFTDGDVERRGFQTKTGLYDYEGRLGELAGPVSVCKMGHHGCANAVGTTFAQNIRAQVYTACMWCPRQAHPETLGRIVSVGNNPLIVPNLVCAVHRQEEAKYGYHLNRLGAAHVVVKVAPGGGTYRMYLVDATDESMRILAYFDRDA